MSEKIRVRFAPSPTGPLHMGGVRTALYNYLFAKKNQGTFILRIEDTDQTRFVEGAQEYIIDALNWCGISPDEGPGIGGDFGPYIQSERKKLYEPLAYKLVESGHAYYAFDSEEELNTKREQAKTMGMPNWQYNSITRGSLRNSLNLPQSEVSELLDSKTPFVIRFKMPRNEEVKFFDIVRGWVVVNTNNLDDKVLFKSDGMPTYHLANIIDDHIMEISHVIRGEEWLPSAPLHILLYKAFDWSIPQFAHLPLLLKPDGNGKLSKRDGDRLGFPVFPTNWTTKEGELYAGYREKGYLPGAFINMLAFLGWNPGDNRELFQLNELINEFSLERVSKSGAKFDPDKTKWFQQQHLRSLSNESIKEDLKHNLNTQISDEDLTVIVDLMKERATFINEILTEGEYLFKVPATWDHDFIIKKWKSNTSDIMEQWKNVLISIDPFDKENIENSFKKFLETRSLGFGAVLLPYRILITGVGAGPSMFDISAFLGKDEIISRMELGLNQISKSVEA